MREFAGFTFTVYKCTYSRLKNNVLHVVQFYKDNLQPLFLPSASSTVMKRGWGISSPSFVVRFELFAQRVVAQGVHYSYDIDNDRSYTRMGWRGTLPRGFLRFCPVSREFFYYLSRNAQK